MSKMKTSSRGQKYVKGVQKTIRYSMGEWEVIERIMTEQQLGYSEASRVAFKRLAEQHGAEWPQD